MPEIVDTLLESPLKLYLSRLQIEQLASGRFILPELGQLTAHLLRRGALDLTRQPAPIARLHGDLPVSV